MTAVLNAVLVLAAIAAVCALVLIVASKYMAVPVDEKFPALREALPGAGCGACGFAGCDGYAQALADGSETRVNLCIPGADSTAQALAAVLGVEAEDVVEMCAYVKCNGNCETAKHKYEYAGIESCSAANILFNGEWLCKTSCLGYGDCEKACPSEAIHVVNGVAKVIPQLCTGCGICTRTCPNKIIGLRRAVDKLIVACNNTDKGGQTRAACSGGCIGCMKCQKNCPNGAITVVDNLARIDYDKCTGCGVCVEGCPTKCLKLI